MSPTRELVCVSTVCVSLATVGPRGGSSKTDTFWILYRNVLCVL